VYKIRKLKKRPGSIMAVEREREREREREVFNNIGAHSMY
jgi:hypothetical protein